jgi:hypothetical protein
MVVKEKRGEERKKRKKRKKEVWLLVCFGGGDPRLADWQHRLGIAGGRLGVFGCFGSGEM